MGSTLNELSSCFRGGLVKGRAPPVAQLANFFAAARWGPVTCGGEAGRWLLSWALDWVGMRLQQFD